MIVSLEENNNTPIKFTYSFNNGNIIEFTNFFILIILYINILSFLPASCPRFTGDRLAPVIGMFWIYEPSALQEYSYLLVTPN